MHIVHVVRQFRPSIGGLEDVVWELATGQAAAGQQVRVVTLDRIFRAPSPARLPEREMDSGVEIVRIPFTGSTRYPIAPSVIRHIRDADIVHVHGIDFFFDYLAWTTGLHRRPLVVSTHGGFFHTSWAARLKRIYFATFTRLALSRYAGVATVSAADDALFRSIRTRGISCIENGVNLDKYRGCAAPNLSKTLIAVGRLSGNKRLDLLISFLAAVRRADPDWRLIVAGRPWDVSAEDLKAMARDAGVDEAVEIVASPSDQELRALMGRCSILLSASEYEGFGVAAVEGLSAGLVPVLSGIAPFRRLVGRTGIGRIVDFAEPSAAAAELLAYWSEIESDHAQLCRRAMRAAEDYDWRRVGKRYQAFYDAVLGTKGRAILDVTVQVSTVTDAVGVLDDRFDTAEPATVVFANAHTLNTTMSSEKMSAALRKAIVFNDGVGLDIASRLLFGKPFPENMNGTDFVPAYLRQTRNRYRVFLLGAKQGIAAKAAAAFSALAPQHQVVGCAHGYLGEDETERVIEEIWRSRADILLVGMGDPKQEVWLMDHLADTGCRLGFCAANGPTACCRSPNACGTAI
jgi:alpha-1,3-mannosyltransferase